MKLSAEVSMTAGNVVDLEAYARAVADYAEEIAGEVAEEARRRVPVKEGRLKKSIKVAKRDGRIFVRAYGTKSRHGHLVEYGHIMVNPHTGAFVGHVPAYPFLRPALDTVVAQITSGSFTPSGAKETVQGDGG